MSDREDSDEFEHETLVDNEAREQIDRLRRRFEGAHLVPSIWVLFKQSFQSTIRWAGWEIFGLGSFVLLGLALLCLIVFTTFSGCQNLDVDMDERRAAAEREQYSPACEALGLVFTGVTRSRRGDYRVDDQVVCTGSDRIVTLDINDLDETEVQFIEENQGE